MIYDLKTEKCIIPTHFGNALGLILQENGFISIHPEQVVKVDLKDIRHDTKLTAHIIVDRGGKAIQHDKSGDCIYLALNDGLYLLRNKKMTELKWNGEPIFAAAMTALNNKVYVGTKNQGVLELENDVIKRQLKFLNTIENITVRALYVKGQQLWGCTNSDFFRIDLTNGKMEQYSRNLGINAKDVNSICSIGDVIFLGAKKHLHSLPMELHPTNSHKPKIFFTKISCNNGETLSENMELPYDFSNLQFDFTAFSYRSRKNLTYKYRLKGFNNDWVSTTFDNPNVVYSSLPWGNYKFEVMAVNESGLAGNVISYTFSVTPPVWQRGWFYIIATICSVVIMYLFFQRSIQTMRKRNEIEKKLINSQLSALKAQMNPHFMYNALNSIQSLILKQDIKNSNLYLSKFSNLMRKVLDASGKESISLQEETSILMLYLDLEKLRFGEDFNYSLHLSDQIDPYAVHIPSMILQPFVENALKHGLLHKKGEKKLNLDFELVDQQVICTIQDNGIGRVRSKEIQNRASSSHRSFAIAATEKRVELLNAFAQGKYQVEVLDMYENDLASGTKVTIKIPLHADSEN
jgi:hypothetical protein